MQGLLIRFFGRKYKVPLICATLLRYGVNRKKLSLIASRRNDHERTVHLYTVRNYFTAEQILCLDEARIDARSQHREHGYGQGRRVHGLRYYIRNQAGHSCLAFISLGGVLGVCISPARGINKEMFLLDFRTHILPHLNPFPGPRSVVTMDNAIVHNVPELFDLIRQAGAYLHFFPAYGYDLNPVEKVISKARAWLARNRDVAESNPLLAIRRAFASVTATHIAGYYRSCGIAVEEVAEGLFM